MSEDKPCICWCGPPVIHSGHCCFDPRGDNRSFWAESTTYQAAHSLPCGHQDEGLRISDGAA